ncbi:MAG: hypothetical protein H6Q55_2642 [Deltaproteobacteria bacterium]|jgi:hypothetical protein|nr:hypothetical protein [Deltaproteobacteria bacterium]
MQAEVRTKAKVKVETEQVEETTRAKVKVE